MKARVTGGVAIAALASAPVLRYIALTEVVGLAQAFYGNQSDSPLTRVVVCLGHSGQPCCPRCPPLCGAGRSFQIPRRPQGLWHRLSCCDYREFSAALVC